MTREYATVPTYDAHNAHGATCDVTETDVKPATQTDHGDASEGHAQEEDPLHSPRPLSDAQESSASEASFMPESQSEVAMPTMSDSHTSDAQDRLGEGVNPIVSNSPPRDPRIRSDL